MSATVDLRCGRWQEVLADVAEVDSVISDPPYSARTIEGQRSGTLGCSPGVRGTIGYDPITEDGMRAFVRHWGPRARRWIVIFGDHYMMRWAEDEAVALGLYVHPPLPWVKYDPAPRLRGDGPDPGSESILVARPRRRVEVRHRPGWYATHQERGGIVTGAKPLALMRAIVRDYSEPGDLVCDPHAGGATTLLAAVIEGRRAIGAEMNPKTFAKAQARIASGYTPSMFPGDPKEAA